VSRRKVQLILQVLTIETHHLSLAQHVGRSVRLSEVLQARRPRSGLRKEGTGDSLPAQREKARPFGLNVAGELEQDHRTDHAGDGPEEVSADSQNASTNDAA
jgi:hypothetical protein